MLSENPPSLNPALLAEAAQATAKIEALEEQEGQLAAKYLTNETNIPTTLGDVRQFLGNHLKFEFAATALYLGAGISDFADHHLLEAENCRQRLASLNPEGDGQSAYSYFRETRDIQLKAAEGRNRKKARFQEDPTLERGPYTDEFLDNKREQHLEKARLHETAARIIAQEKNLPHEPIEI